jgi:hypothetical protein
MKVRRIAALAVAVTGVLAIAGCPLVNIPGTTPTFAGFPSTAALTGRFTFGGNSPPQALEAGYKEPGGSRSTEKATSDGQGYFSFAGATDGKEYQVIWDDQGQEASDDKVNTIGVYVSDAVTAKKPPASTTNPQVQLDLKWEPLTGSDASPKPAASVTKSASTKFTFATITNLGATYQISLFNSTKGAVTPTASGTTSPLTVDTSSLAAGDYYYQIKFFKTGGTFGGKNFYGSTKYVKIKLQ